jgi:hypothetical protein
MQTHFGYCTKQKLSITTYAAEMCLLYENTLGCLEPFQNFIWFLTVPSTDKILTTLHANLFQHPREASCITARVCAATDYSLSGTYWGW